jgi:large subunit ribosomal protein L22
MPTKFDARLTVKYSPRKVRLIINQIRGAKLDAALAQLTFMQKGHTRDVAKLLLNAANNLSITEGDFSQFKIKTIVAEEADRLYRMIPRARGSANRIVRRHCRIRVELAPL